MLTYPAAPGAQNVSRKYSWGAADNPHLTSAATASTHSPSPPKHHRALSEATEALLDGSTPRVLRKLYPPRVRKTNNWRRSVTHGPYIKIQHRQRLSEPRKHLTQENLHPQKTRPVSPPAALQTKRKFPLSLNYLQMNRRLLL